MEMGNKHDKLRIYVPLQGHNLVASMEAWWVHGVQGLSERQAGKTRRGSFPLCETTTGMHGALPGDG